MTSLLYVVIPFVLASAVVLMAGIRLARYGDVIAVRTGLGRTWMGLVVMAGVTSLPELFTGASAIVLVDVPDIAAGDAIGSCMFNLVILAMLDFRHPRPLSTSIHQGHVLAAAFGMVQLGLAALAMAAGIRGPMVGWVGLQTFVFLGLYGFAAHLIFKYERGRISELAEEIGGNETDEKMSLRTAVLWYSVAAALLISAAAYLPAAAEELAEVSGLGQSFVGSLFVAASTSLPEVVVSVAAARMGALDMAAANLFGSNIFNVAVLGIDDLLYTRGSLLSAISPVHMITLVTALIMTAVAIIGLTYRAQKKRFRLSWDSLVIVGLYALGTWLLWRVQ